MLLIFAASFALSITYVTANVHDTFISTIAMRQIGTSTTKCNALCSKFTTVKTSCKDPHCECTIPFLQAQGECTLCQTDTPDDAAAVQFLLDAEMRQCHSKRIQINFQLQLPPAATAIVKRFNSGSVRLRREQTAFLAIQIAGGQFGLVILLLFALFSRTGHRESTFFNFCITWFFSSIAFSLALYRGTDNDNTLISTLGQTTPTTCLMQAALISGAQVMTACSTMALVIQLWLGLRTALHGGLTNGPRPNRLLTIAFIVTPYILFLVFALSAAFIGRQHFPHDGVSSVIIVNDAAFPNRVLPTNFYCTVELNAFVRTVYAVTLGLLIITVFFDALIVRILYKNWRALRRVQNKSGIKLSILLRVMVFSLFRVLVATAYGTVLAHPSTIRAVPTRGGDILSTQYGVPRWVDILQATLPLVGFLVLSTNTEMMSTFCCWRRSRGWLNKIESTDSEKQSLEVLQT